MKKSSSSRWKKVLLESIDMISKNKESYFENPETSFSRTQKITLWDTMLFPMVADNEATPIELLDYFKADKLPSQPAMSYRRDQLKVSAYQAVFNDFSTKIPQKKTFHGMHVIACDGTRINTPYNPKDKDSFVNSIEGRKGFNQYHLITCFDVLNEVFTDVVIQNYYSMNEKQAFCTMLDRYSKTDQVLFVADRGFAAYNVIAHAMNNGHNFLIRVTEPMARNVFHDTVDIDNFDVFDIEDICRIGRSRSRQSKSLKNYHFMGYKNTYDSVSIGSKEIDSFSIRLVKFQLPGGDHEYLVTNLSKSTFTTEHLKELYRMRWGVETSYRYLKYAAGMVHMHSIKQKFIFQEIYAKLTLYNFCTAIGQCTRTKNSADLKHKYVVEKTYLIKVCIRFLKNILSDIITLIEKRKVPVRANRKFERNLRRRHADTLQCR